MKKSLFAGIIISVIALSGCSTSTMEQKEYKNRLDYCSKIDMDVQIAKNEKSHPTKVECIDKHGSVFDSKLAY